MDATLTPKVTVLMPAYKQAEYISEALDSLISQTYTNWECAIVDDGSPDNVEEVVKPYIERDRRIKFYHTDNHGVSAARNFAAKMTDGEYIIPLDADDTFHPDYLEECVRQFALNPDTMVVRGDWQFFGTHKPTPSLPYTGYQDLLMNNSIFCSAMFRRKDFERIGGFDEKIPYGFEDWEFWIRLLAPQKSTNDAEGEIPEAGKVTIVKRPLFNYRIKPVSRSTEAEGAQRHQTTLRYIYQKNFDIYRIFFPDMLQKLKDLSILQRRLDKWKKRSVFSRLWYAITGKF